MVRNFDLAAALAQLNQLDDARTAVKAGLRSIRPLLSLTLAPLGQRRLKDPTYLTTLESINRVLQRLRRAIDHPIRRGAGFIAIQFA